MVEVASSWSASSTRAALTPRTRSGPGAGLSRAANRAARAPRRGRSSGSTRATSDGEGGEGLGRASASTIEAARRRAVAVTTSGRRSLRSRSPAPAITTTHRRRSERGHRRGRCEVQGCPGLERGRLARAARPPGPRPHPLGHLFEGVDDGEVGGPETPVDGAVVGELGHAGGHGGHPGLHRLALAGPTGQALHVVQGEQAPAPTGGRVRGQQAPAHVGVEGGDLDPQPAGGLVALQHPVHPPHPTGGHRPTVDDAPLPPVPRSPTGGRAHRVRWSMNRLGLPRSCPVRPSRDPRATISTPIRTPN